MSDPRYTDPRRTDPLRRFDLQGSSSAGTMWTWVAAIIAVIVVLGLVIGYSRTDQASNQPNQPTTTGAAPSPSRPAPPAKSGDKSGDVPAPAAPAPAAPAPAPNQ
jgi:hypothetical protein